MPSPFQDRIAPIIERAGFFIQFVFDAEGINPPFGYTIGLSPRYGFELIAFVPDPDFIGGMFNYLAANVLPHDKLDGNVPMQFDEDENMPLLFKDCSPELVKDYAVQAFLYYDNPAIRFVQMVLPDENDCFPGDAEYDSYGMDWQRKLYDTSME